MLGSSTGGNTYRFNNVKIHSIAVNVKKINTISD